MEMRQEIAAMTAVSNALEELEDDAARIRVLRWAVAAYARGTGQGQTAATGGGSDLATDLGGETKFKSIVQLFEAGNPTSRAQRVLLACYWQQQSTGKEEFSSQAVNTDLKNLGHSVSNITAALSALKSREPALVRQTSKTGTAQQARKTYILTEAGKKAVREMLSRNQHPSAEPTV